MGMTLEQIKAVWFEQQHANSLRYKFMTQGDKNIYDAELLEVFEEIKDYLFQRYGSDTGDYGSIEDYIDDGQDPIYPPQATTVVGHNITITSQSEKHKTFVNTNGHINEDIEGNIAYWNLNFFDILDHDNIYAKVNMLEQIWLFLYDPRIPVIPNPQATNQNAVISNDVIYKRFLEDINTHDPLNPDQFHLNQYFVMGDGSEGNIIWVNKYDPTQQLIWSDLVKLSGVVYTGVLKANNKIPLDQGLNQGQYDPDHPEDIDSTWSLESSGSGVWIWMFNNIIQDLTYRLQITQQVGGNYLHAIIAKDLAIEDWYKIYVGDLY